MPAIFYMISLKSEEKKLLHTMQEPGDAAGNSALVTMVSDDYISGPEKSFPPITVSKT